MSEITNDIEIASATPEDGARLCEIYAPYVEKTAVTFETVAPSPEQMSERIAQTLERYPFVVARRAGTIVGYAYAGPFRARAAYDWSAEVSIYLAEDERGHGTGALLYDALEDALRRMGIVNLYACIACCQPADERLTDASIRFHRKRGFTGVGRFAACAFKFDRWYDMVWMEKILSAHTDPPSPVTWWSEVQ